jgi:putative CocE/NonD family hydrolase
MTSRPFLHSLCGALAGLVLSEPASAQALRMAITGSPDSAELAATMKVLARAAIARLGEADTEKSLHDRILLHSVAGDPAAANAALERMRKVAKPADPGSAAVLHMCYELHSRAILTQAAAGGSFEDAFKKSFRDIYDRLDDLSANHASWYLVHDVDRARADLQSSLDKLRGKTAIQLDDAIELARLYGDYTIHRDILPLTGPLRTEDNGRRYEIQDDVRIKTRDGATVSATVVRPRRATTPQPAVLFFSIYTARGSSDAIQIAAHGYVGIAAFSRGKRNSPDEILPYEHDVNDTYDTIDWIRKQPWCDGRVGMYGGSYAGFTQWAATKHLHPALKTIVPYVAAIPGQGLPMENNVFLNANYGWAFYVSNGRFDDDKVYFDPGRWNTLNKKWYASGRPYREIDRVDGTPNRLLQRWLAHPAYDAYWQAMVPYGQDFARIDIPILSVTGYYDDGQISALRYFTEHYKYNKNARHYLLIGPYDHFGAQRRPSPVLRGYAIDPVARIDTTYITFQWLDHVLRGGPMPELLMDKINYEVMGANRWRHAPTLEKMHDEVLTLYLDDHRLSPAKRSSPRSLDLEIDFADRKTSNNNSYYPSPIVRDRLDASGGIVFVGEPFAEPASIDGAFAGELRASINKKDMDIGVQLYELTPEGKYFCLSYFLGRASYARDMGVRQLLTPDNVEAIPFERTRMVSRQLAKGSRLVVVVNVNKNSFAQMNYGTGKDVSDESIADAKVPLRVKWYGDSYVKIPLRR